MQYCAIAVVQDGIGPLTPSQQQNPDSVQVACRFYPADTNVANLEEVNKSGPDSALSSISDSALAPVDGNSLDTRADQVFGTDSRLGKTHFNDPAQVFRSSAIVRGSAVFDLFAIGASFAIVHFIRLGSLEFSSERVITLFVALSLLVLVFTAGGIYPKTPRRSIVEECWQLVVCWAIGFAALAMFAYFSGVGDEVSRIWVAGSMLMALMLIIVYRAMSWALFSSSIKKRDRRDVVLIGCGTGFDRAFDQINASATAAVNIVQIYQLDSWSDSSQNFLSALHVSSTLDSACRFIEQRRLVGQGIDEVWIALPDNLTHYSVAMEEMFHDSATDVCFIPNGFTRRLLHGKRQHLDNLDVVNISSTALPDGAERFKRVFDILVAGCALCVFAIPMAVIAVMVKVETPGPVLFRQPRYGMDGQVIEVWKFRSMRVHADAQVIQASRGDKRVTHLGRFLRRTSLDELPQFFNVLQGTMSVIGPRPHAVTHNEHWRGKINGYMLRHKVKPGITGLAQINGWRGETDTAEKMEQRVRCDLDYIRNWSPSLDIKILCRTLQRGFSDSNAF